MSDMAVDVAVLVGKIVLESDGQGRITHVVWRDGVRASREVVTAGRAREIKAAWQGEGQEIPTSSGWRWWVMVEA